jgi:hypothetical protein
MEVCGGTSAELIQLRTREILILRVSVFRRDVIVAACAAPLVVTLAVDFRLDLRLKDGALPQCRSDFQKKWIMCQTTEIPCNPIQNDRVAELGGCKPMLDKKSR